MRTSLTYKIEFGTLNRSIKIILSLILILTLITPLKNQYSDSCDLYGGGESLSILTTPDDLIPTFNTTHCLEAGNFSTSKITSYSPFPVALTGKFSVVGVDTDSNLLFNKIKMSIEVNSTVSKSFTANFRLEWNFGQIIEYPIKIIWLNLGIQNITYEFNPRESYNSFDNFSCIFEYFYIRYAYLTPVSPEVKFFLEVDSFYTSREFHSFEFDKPEAFITGSNNIIEVDTDGDGLINFFNVSTELNISKSDIYTISLDFIQNSSKDSIWKSITKFLEEGTVTIEFTCLLGDLYTQKTNSSYLIKSIEVFSHLDRVHSSTNSNSTRSYSYSEFDPPGVFLTKNYSDQGLDTDADGLFNYLSITIELNVTVEDIYKISGFLLSDETTFYQEWWDLDLRLPTGIHQVSIEFSIKQDPYYSWNDSFILDEFCIQNSTDQIIVDESNLYITTRYQSTSFDPPVIYLLDNFWDQGVDSDEDQGYDYLEIVVEVNITENISDYLSLMTLNDSRSVEISAYISIFLPLGVHNISFFFDADSILESFRVPGVDNIFFEVSLFRVYDSERLMSLERESMYTTSEYTFSSFEAREPSQSTTIREKSTTTTSSSPKNDTVTQIRIILLVIFIILLIDLYRDRKN